MFKIVLRIFLALIFWGIFGYVVLQVPYPDSLTQANLIQIIPFFVSLFLALTATLNILFENILASFSVSLGLTFLLILKALDSLSWVTGGLILVSVVLLFSYFRKGEKKSLTKQSKIPKLINLRRREK